MNVQVTNNITTIIVFSWYNEWKIGIVMIWNESLVLRNKGTTHLFLCLEFALSFHFMSCVVQPYTCDSTIWWFWKYPTLHPKKNYPLIIHIHWKTNIFCIMIIDKTNFYLVVGFLQGKFLTQAPLFLPSSLGISCNQSKIIIVGIQLLG